MVKRKFWQKKSFKNKMSKVKNAGEKTLSGAKAVGNVAWKGAKVFDKLVDGKQEDFRKQVGFSGKNTQRVLVTANTFNQAVAIWNKKEANGMSNMGRIFKLRNGGFGFYCYGSQVKNPNKIVKKTKNRVMKKSSGVYISPAFR